MERSRAVDFIQLDGFDRPGEPIVVGEELGVCGEGRMQRTDEVGFRLIEHDCSIVVSMRRGDASEIIDTFDARTPLG